MDKRLEESEIISKLMKTTIDNKMLSIALIRFLQESKKNELDLNLDQAAEELDGYGIQIMIDLDKAKVHFEIIKRNDKCKHMH